MQINQVNSNIPKRITKQQTGRKEANVNNTQSFKGLGMALDKFSLGVANAIENGGLFVSFTLQDMLGTNLPRPLMGLKRNLKENKGQANKSFAAKELVREFLTGPSMFIIPATMLSIAKPLFGKTINIPMKAIKALGDIHAEQAVNSAGQALSQQEFIQNAFTRIIQNAKDEAAPSSETVKKASEFAKKLVDNLKDKAGKKAAIGEITSEFVDISKNFVKDSAHTDFTAAKLSETTSVPIKDAISYISAYADDVVEKVKTKDVGKLKDIITKITNNKVIGRFAMNTIMFAAVMAFLQVIPKLYNKAEGHDNAGLKGLMKEETLNDKTLDDKNINKNINQKDKSKPSFGSAASFANKLTSSSLFGRIVQGAEFEGCNVSFPLLLAVMCFGILLPRTRQAKDKYDREEILRRDITSCIVMCFGEKELRKGFAKMNEGKSGLVLSAKSKGFEDKNLFKRIFEYLRPIKGVKVFSTDQIVSKYSGIDKYKNGIADFCEFIDNQGGNLKKIFSLTDESKSLVESVLQKEGKTLADADNSIIKEVLTKAKGSKEVERLVNLFKDPENPWVKKAKTLNARFTALSVIVLVPFLLGFFLPWFNEKTTKRKFTEDNAAKINNNNQPKVMNTDYFAQNTPELFGDIAKFTR